MSVRLKNKIRLYTDTSLILGRIIELNPQDSHYLCNVMRLTKGAALNCFNAKDGEYECQIVTADKKHCSIRVDFRVNNSILAPDIWLLFAPLKKDKTDFVIEKATELGVHTIVPIITQNTIAEKVRTERFSAQAKEAAEQCERTDIPIIKEAVRLKDLLCAWPQERRLFFLDETLSGKDCLELFNAYKNQPAAILVGPEGGFSSEEKELIDSLPFACGVSLGPRILRAETAACAALSIWQAVCGDWSKGE